MVPPNELYTAFSFIGFLLCAIPMTWHLEAWNVGTCFYMGWTGLGCLIQCINSIVWNKNMINRAPIYCDIVTRIQVAIPVAIPASSLCICRRLYKIATVQAVMVTRTEKRRRVIVDVLICLGIPILQMAVQFVVEGRRYEIYEDFGPSFRSVLVWPAIPLLFIWPTLIGCVSLVYSSMTIYQFYKRERQFKEIMSSSRGLNRSRYLRLIILCSIDMVGTVPIASYIMLGLNLKNGLRPWVNWANVHSDYNVILQYPNINWKHVPDLALQLELFRWTLVLCAFIFFGLFGFADEARQNYRRLYRSLASRVGSSTLSGTIGSSHVTSSLPHLKSEAGGVMVSVEKSRTRRDSTLTFSDQLSIPSISIASDLKPDFTTEQLSPLESMASTSVSSFTDGLQSQLPQLPKTAPAFVPVSAPSQLPDTANSTIPSTLTHSPDAADIV